MHCEQIFWQVWKLKQFISTIQRVQKLTQMQFVTPDYLHSMRGKPNDGSSFAFEGLGNEGEVREGDDDTKSDKECEECEISNTKIEEIHMLKKENASTRETEEMMLHEYERKAAGYKKRALEERKRAGDVRAELIPAK